MLKSKAFIFIFFAVIILIVSVRMLLPFAIKLGAEQYFLKNLNTELSFHDIHLSLIEGRLEARNLAISKTKYEGLQAEIQKIAITLDFRSILDKKLIIKIFEIDDVTITATDVFYQRLMGTELSTVKDLPSNDNKTDHTQSDDTALLSFGLDQITLSNINVTLGDHTHFAIQRAQLKSIYEDKTDDPALFTLDAMINHQPFTLEGTLHLLNRDLSSSGKLQLKDWNLEDLKPSVRKFLPFWSMESLKGQVGNLSQKFEFSLGKKQYVKLAGNLTASECLIPFPTKENVSLSKITFYNDIIWHNRSLDVNVNVVNLQDFEYLNAEQNQLKASDLKAEIKAQNLQRQDAVKGSVSATINGLTLKDKDIQQFYSQKVVISHGRLDSVSPLLIKSNEISLYGFTLGPGSSVHQRKNKSDSLVLHDLKITQLRSEQSPTRKYNLQSKIGKYGDLNFIYDIDQNNNFMSAGEIKAFDLTKVSEFVHSLLGYNINTGILSANYSLYGKGEHITGDLKLVLTKLDLDSDVSEEIAEKKAMADAQESSQLGYPIPLALQMLEDDLGQVHLTFPISIAPNETSIGFKVILMDRGKKLLLDHLMNSLGNALVASLLPALATSVVSPNLAFMMMKEGYKFMTKLRFKPIMFEPLESTIGVESESRLEKIAQVLNKHPKVSLHFCALADPEEIAQFDKNYVLKSKKSEKFESELKQATLTLAEKRTEKVADYLIHKKHVLPEQVLICKPKVVKEKLSKQNRPRVNVYI